MGYGDTFLKISQKKKPLVYKELKKVYSNQKILNDSFEFFQNFFHQKNLGFSQYFVDFLRKMCYNKPT